MSHKLVKDFNYLDFLIVLIVKFIFKFRKQTVPLLWFFLWKKEIKTLNPFEYLYFKQSWN